MIAREKVDLLSHIPDAEVLQDIADTEREITQMEAEGRALRLLGDTGDRMACMRADARISRIDERRKFIAKLRELLAERGRIRENAAHQAR